MFFLIFISVFLLHLLMPSPYINVHTHEYIENTETEFSLPNIIIGSDVQTTQLCSVGIHPHYITSSPLAQLNQLRHAIKETRVIAIGECGLDKLCKSDWKTQVMTFRAQIAIANQVNKPLIIHCVRAYQECLKILNEEKVQVPVIFHGFNKHLQLAEQILKEGYYLSLDPIIIHGKKDALIEKLPLEKIFLETDGKAIKITAIYTYFCEVRKIGLNQLKEQINRNFKNVFNRFV